MSNIQLSPAQHAILAYAINHTNGNIEWFPPNVNGGARHKVLQGLLARNLVSTYGSDWIVGALGYEALGHTQPEIASIATTDPDPELEADVAAAEASFAHNVATDPSESVDAEVQLVDAALEDESATAGVDCPVGIDVPTLETDATQGETLPTTTPTQQPLPKVIRTREHSKQATVIQMLQRPEGATIAQICEVTNWLPHTARGALAGALKKKLGLCINSEKTQGQDRVYRVSKPAASEIANA